MNTLDMSPDTFLLYLLIMLSGALLGGVFFGGLWWTVRRLPQAKHPALLTLASLSLRIALVVFGLYGLMAGEIPRLVAALLGFWLIRLWFMRRMRVPSAGTAPPGRHNIADG